MVVATVVTAATWCAAVVRRVRTAAVVRVLAAMSGLFYLMPLLLTGNMPPRYTLVPVLLLLSTIACAVDGLRETLSRVPRLALQGLLVAVLVVVWSANFRVWNRRAGGPSWSQEVAAATARCRAEPLDVVDVPITPLAPEGWKVTVPCERLTSSG